MSLRTLKASFSILVIILLIVSATSFALAAPGLQTGSGTDQQGQQGDEQQGTEQQSQEGDQQQGDQPGQPGQQQDAQQGQPQGDQPTVQDQTGPAQACAQTYTVQQGDTLGLIASRFFNSAQAYTDIIDATNNAAGTGGNFSRIDDPNLISAGQMLCIPATAGGTAAVTGTTTVTGTAAVTGTGTTTGTVGVTDQQMFNIPQGQGMVIVENVSGSDIVFDLTQPAPSSAWVGPDQQLQFTLSPGQHSFNAHHPTGDFSMAGSFQVTAGQVTWLSCNRSICQLVPTGQQNQQQMGDQQGQPGTQQDQPGTQQGQQQDDQQQDGQQGQEGSQQGDQQGGDQQQDGQQSGDGGGQ